MAARAPDGSGWRRNGERSRVDRTRLRVPELAAAQPGGTAARGLDRRRARRLPGGARGHRRRAVAYAGDGGWCVQAQREDEPVAWITRTASTFFPPDAAEGGVDLAALPVIRLDGLRQRLRAADQLARSGAFGLLVVDLGDCLDLPLAVQTRLAEQALAHGTLILCLTEKTERQPSLGSLVAVRAQARRVRHGPDRYACQVQALKDKRRGPGWTDREWCRGPDGLR